MKSIFPVAIIFSVLSLAGCGDKKSEKNSVVPPHMEGNTKTFRRNKKDTNKLSVELKFPDTLCGRLSRKLMDCHLEKITNDKKTDVAFKKSISTGIRQKFGSNMDKYISHCEKATKNLDKKEVDKCLKMECKEMDQCLQKTAGKL
ncbi:MAG: hypothetical protein JXR95_14045 [Deltaproteobacteria bacterium]|nr:hypothetical protein [Deltaproteobacteria bacterium]